MLICYTFRLVYRLIKVNRFSTNKLTNKLTLLNFEYIEVNQSERTRY